MWLRALMKEQVHSEDLLRHAIEALFQPMASSILTVNVPELKSTTLSHSGCNSESSKFSIHVRTNSIQQREIPTPPPSFNC
ncbi:hypothetical protein FVEG_03216 [Fusarium verticillioides 7600]|uniref:Uncharacterized protein n=1 Tax=Gibberella moniliformis (strain M3125 / FGSC 7600) TaxID=334819 RepID=W7M0C4_GIBM7|nr:hypothetical protein FVEG_03216 [Fusarium verticillioides 7600]EWG41025.1 hypothetical protein FVEG_03216 [Fusarium verticillioides 7600]